MDTTTVTTPPCIMCGKQHSLEVSNQGYVAWYSGMNIQDAFPELSADDRELLMTGTCPECWDKLFGDDEE